MAFDWKSLIARLDPRQLKLPALASARAFLVANRTAVLSASVALLAGLWGGAVLGRVGASAPALGAVQMLSLIHI